MNPVNHSLVVPLILALSASSGYSQGLVPDDPAIVDNLAAWFRDAANTFDSETGVWSDSSGNENHAEPVGEVSLISPVTFVGPSPGTISGGAFSTEEVSSVHFTGSVDDLLVAPDLNSDAGLSELTIFVVYNTNFLGANPNLTRAVGFGSISATQINAGNHFNLAGDPSLRKDNGQLGSGTYSGVFPVETTFIRTARMSETSVDEWFNPDGTPSKVLSITGSSYTTSSDDYFIGDVRCGATSTPGFAATAVADFDVIETIVYTAALTDEQVAGVNEWLGHNIGSGSSGSAPSITAIDVDPTTDSATIVWASRAGRTYAVDVSEDLEVWEELDDGVVAEGETTSYTEAELGGPVRRFYRVREL